MNLKRLALTVELCACASFAFADAKTINIATDGNPRVRQARPDIGCYETQVKGLLLLIR